MTNIPNAHADPLICSCLFGIWCPWFALVFHKTSSLPHKALVLHPKPTAHLCSSQCCLWEGVRNHLRHAVKGKIIAQPCFLCIISLFKFQSVQHTTDSRWKLGKETQNILSWFSFPCKLIRTKHGLIYENTHMMSGCIKTVGSEISLGRLSVGQNTNRWILSG